MFSGYTDEAFEFFMAIKFNNNREFFTQNHDWYYRAVREPSVALAAELSDVVEEMDDEMERRPQRVVSRINRDVRFSRDKSPYRDNLWIAYRRPGQERGKTIGVYFDFDARSGCYGMGFYDENKPMMNALRRRLEQDETEFLRLWHEIEDEFTLYPKSLKRIKIPETLSEEAKIWYPLKGFYVEKELGVPLLKSPALVDELARGFRKLTPLYRYFRELDAEGGTL